MADLPVSAEQRFQDLPLYVKESLTCLCDVQGKRPANKKMTRYQINEFSNGNPIHVFFCDLCFKPQRYMVHMVVETCDECEKYYVPGEYPVKWRLCAECDGGRAFTGPPVYVNRNQRRG